MDQFQAWEQFLQTIGKAIGDTATALNTIASKLNPSGLSSTETAQFASDLANVATAAQNLSATALAAAAAAGQGQTPPATGGDTGSTN